MVADGEDGELVFTSLSKEAFPVIRYRTRDLTRLLPPTSRAFRRMGKITGRSDDMLIIRGVNVFPTQIEEQILSIPELSPHYFIELRKEGHLDAIEVNVELSARTHPEGADDAEQALRHRIKSYIGVSASVRVHPNGGIPRSEGKAKRVVDNRKV